MRFALAGSATRLPRWVPIIAALGSLLLFAQLLAPVKHLVNGQAASERHVRWRLGSHTLQLDLRLGDAPGSGSDGSGSQLTSQATIAGVGSGTAAEVVEAGAEAEAPEGGPTAAPAAAKTAEPATAASETAAQETAAAEAAADTGGGVDLPPAGEAKKQAPGGQQQKQQQPRWPHVPLPPGTLTCEVSGYCSLGKTRTWRGDIATNAALRDMLEAVSFKKEIILVAFNSPADIWAQMALNIVRSLEDLGLGNVFLLGSEERVCTGLLPAFDYVSCVWDTRPGADGTDLQGAQIAMYTFWAKRWETAARIVRMGYNLLVVDSDAMVHHDPFVFLKSGPLAKYNLMFQNDGPDKYPNGVNCGVVYWQNAHPSGPAVWAAVELADRTFRQREAVEEMKKVYPKWTSGHTWEQAVWQDMLRSIDGGFPSHTMVNDLGNEEWAAVAAEHRDLQLLKCSDVPFPPEMFNVTGRLTVPMCDFQNIRLPRPPDQAWWKQHGHLYYPLKRGPRSQAFIDLIQAASDQPFPEIDKPWQPLEPPPPAEHASYIPNFFATGYIFRGAHFFGASQPPPQVVSHTVHLNSDSKDWKVYLFKGHFWWHWEVTEAFTGNNVLGVEDPKLLMLAPGVHLLQDTEQAFRDEVKKLVVLAEALGRRLVVPPAPCDSPWIGIWKEPPEREEIYPDLPMWEESYDASQVLQFPDRQRPGHSYCHWIRNVVPECTAQLLPHSDAVAYLERSLTPAQAAPSADNTLWFKEWEGAGGVAAEAGKSAAVGASVAAVKEAAERFSAAPVLFLGALPRLEGPVEQLPEQYNACAFFHDGYHFEHSPEMRKRREDKIAAAANATAAAEGKPAAAEGAATEDDKAAAAAAKSKAEAEAKPALL